MSQLTLEQKQTISKYINSYNNWLQTFEGQDNLKVHREHNSFFSEKLSEKNIDKMNETEFREVYKKYGQVTYGATKIGI